MKRSQWFEGVLWAENFLRCYYYASEHMFVQDADGMQQYEILFRRHRHEKPWIVKTDTREFGKGVLDYIEHKDRINKC